MIFSSSKRVENTQEDLRTYVQHFENKTVKLSGITAIPIGRRSAGTMIIQKIRQIWRLALRPELLRRLLLLSSSEN